MMEFRQRMTKSVSARHELTGCKSIKDECGTPSHTDIIFDAQYLIIKGKMTELVGYVQHQSNTKYHCVIGISSLFDFSRSIYAFEFDIFC